MGDPVTAETTGIDSVETGTDGVARFTGLKAGYYIVKEIKLPAGYVQTGTGSFCIKIDNGTVTLVDKDGWVPIEGNAKLRFTAVSGSNSASVTVGNDAGISLPSTGGSGIRMLYLLGSTLVILAGAGFILRRKKE